MSTAIERLKAAATSAQQRVTEKQQARIAKGTARGWRLAWEQALREYYPENVVEYTSTQATNLRQAIARGFPREDMSKFLAWVVKEWQWCRRFVFSNNPKVARGPESPEMGMVIFNIAKLHAAYKRGTVEFQTTVSLEKRAGSLALKPAPSPSAEPAKPAPKPLRKPQAAFASLKPPPARPVQTSASKPLRLPGKDEAGALANKLGLKQWD